MDKIKIERINELARKSKIADLTDDEKEEQKILRREFLDEIKADIKATLDNVEIIDNTPKS